MKVIEVVAAVIYYEGKYLATQRGYGEWRGFWEFPGGKIEPEESREEALIREIREELRMEIVPEQWLCTTEYDYPTFHLTMHCYLCRIVEGTPQLTEHLAAQWLSPEELHSVQWLPADVEVTSRILNSEPTPNRVQASLLGIAEVRRRKRLRSRINGEW